MGAAGAEHGRKDGGDGVQPGDSAESLRHGHRLAFAREPLLLGRTGWIANAAFSVCFFFFRARVAVAWDAIV